VRPFLFEPHPVAPDPDFAADHVSRREYACGIGEVTRREVLSMKDEDKRKFSIEEEAEWRFVDEFGRVELDADMLSMHITVRELRFIRACVVRAIEELEGGAR
jgi:hypothetical protein